MPYGVSKAAGGDTKQSSDWIDRCVERVTSKGQPRENAIRICKAAYQRNHGEVKALRDKLKKG